MCTRYKGVGAMLYVMYREQEQLGSGMKKLNAYLSPSLQATGQIGIVVEPRVGILSICSAIKTTFF